MVELVDLPSEGRAAANDRGEHIIHGFGSPAEGDCPRGIVPAHPISPSVADTTPARPATWCGLTKEHYHIPYF